ncbi:MAG: hypothetical protein ACPGSD_00105 [Flavobacteriales bacterium]
MERIKVNDVIKQMSRINENGQRAMFDLTYRTYNAYNGLGGKLVEYKRCRLVMRNNKKTAEDRLKIIKKVKNPNHWDNMTRNIEFLNGDVKTIHFRFIITFNNQEVIF